MQIDVDMSYEQYWTANRAWLTHTTPFRRWNFWFTWYIYPVFGIAFFFISIILYAKDREVSEAVIFNLMVGFFLLWCRVRYPQRVRKLYKQQEAHFAGLMTLEPTGLDYVRKDGSANAHYAWSAFDLWIDRPEEFLLVPGPASFVRVPKEKLTRQQQEEVRGWLTAIKQAK